MKATSIIINANKKGPSLLTTKRTPLTNTENSTSNPLKKLRKLSQKKNVVSAAQVLKVLSGMTPLFRTTAQNNIRTMRPISSQFVPRLAQTENKPKWMKLRTCINSRSAN